VLDHSDNAIASINVHNLHIIIIMLCAFSPFFLLPFSFPFSYSCNRADITHCVVTDNLCDTGVGEDSVTA